MTINVDMFEKFFTKNYISTIMMVFFVNYLENLNQLKNDAYKAINYQVAEVGKFMYIESPATKELI